MVCWQGCDDITTPAWYLQTRAEVWHGGYLAGTEGNPLFVPPTPLNQWISTFFLEWNCVTGQKCTYCYFVARQHKPTNAIRKHSGLWWLLWSFKYMASAGNFLFFCSTESRSGVQHSPSSKPAAKPVGEPYDRADRYPLMILIFEKHLGAQPQLSGARPILMIFSPILTSKMLSCRSECGVMHADG